MELFSLVWRYQQKYGVNIEEVDWAAIAAELAEKDMDGEECEEHYDFLRTDEYLSKDEDIERVPIQHTDEMDPEEVQKLIQSMPENEQKEYIDNFIAKCKEEATPEEWEQAVSELKENGYEVPASLLRDDREMEEAIHGRKEVPTVYEDIDYTELE